MDACKLLWLKENEAETYRGASHLGEFIDWLTYRLTGQWVASIDNTSIRWYYDRAEGGWPYGFYKQIGLGMRSRVSRRACWTWVRSPGRCCQR